MARSSLTYIPGFSAKLFWGHPRTITPNLVAIDPVVSEKKIKM
jgi:hypothetical protein